MSTDFNPEGRPFEKPRLGFGGSGSTNRGSAYDDDGPGAPPSFQASENFNINGKMVTATLRTFSRVIRPEG